MGKRKNKHDYDYIARKIRKLERKLRREQSTSSSEEDTSPPRYSYYEHGSTEEVMEPELETFLEENTSDPIPQTDAVDAVPSTSVTQSEPVPSTSSLQPQVANVENEVLIPMEGIPPAVELDSEILKIFGEDPSIEKINGQEIQSDLAVRLQHVATRGLSSELRKELSEKHLPPSNCTLIDAPVLNLEIKAAISEIVLKRDKGIEYKQKQLCHAISCLGSAITLMIAKENKDTEIIQMLMDAIRLLCDNQHSDSIVRRNFILHNLKREMKEQLQKTVIDKQLFGSDLAETLKIAKTITKTGTELKSTVSKPPTRAKTVTPPSQSTLQQRNNLNWRAPPPSRRQTGTQRTREPAPRNPPANNSRGSYRARQPTAPAPRTNYRSRR
ncbi:jg24925 [Pararge aegeria aegeria]|uniref:Jg24925 protein n=1 Tax=Pararge aegeria aegeria TaxID=348720 RepID=A0A8S4R3C9_9NEOP|nr:jg24925 [Pararge aegeria aegeria]